MKVGDVYLYVTDPHTDLRWVGIVAELHGEDTFVGVETMTATRGETRIIIGLDASAWRDPKDVVVIGHVDQAIPVKAGESNG